MRSRSKGGTKGGRRYFPRCNDDDGQLGAKGTQREGGIGMTVRRRGLKGQIPKERRLAADAEDEIKRVRKEAGRGRSGGRGVKASGEGRGRVSEGTVRQLKEHASGRESGVALQHYHRRRRARVGGEGQS
ncbi:hypothetical protein KM043_007200 [Ampulex compressa]|nr:hypothetical protein KM043_007200 [Ampulex compressa]